MQSALVKSWRFTVKWRSEILKRIMLSVFTVMFMVLDNSIMRSLMNLLNLV